MIGQKRLDTNYKIDLTEWQINQDNEIDILHNSVVDIDTRVKELEKSGGGGATITIDSEFSETSENPVQNKIITLEINHISSDIDKLTEKTDTHSTSITNIETWVETAKEDLISIDSRITEVENITDTNIDDITSLETRVTNLENGGGGVVTGISYRDSVLYSNKTISLVESSTVGDNEVQTTIENAKVIPISVIPMDSSATWRVYFITGWVYDSVSNSTTIKFIATDTSTNVNIVCLPVIENE